MGLRQSAYDFLIDFFPSREKAYSCKTQLDDDKKSVLVNKCIEIFRRHRVYGGSFALFENDKTVFSFSYGNSKEEKAVDIDTYFRIASISKLFMASCVMKLSELGLIDIDENIADLFKALNKKVLFLSFRSLLTHTSPICDGASYNKYIGTGITLSELFEFSDNYKKQYSEGDFEYSNLGYGMAAVALEEKLGLSYEDIMQKYLFEPLKMNASFYPQTLLGDVASAYRVFPRAKISMDIAERLKRSYDDIHEKGFEKHYSLSPGNCYTNIESAKRLANALMQEGFLSAESLRKMKTKAASFNERDKRLSEGIGIFIVDLNGKNELFYGHQGLAYNAVHGLYFDDKFKDGMVFLSAGASEKRRGVLADVNIDLIELWRNRELWR